MQSTSKKQWAGRSTSWNQDRQEKKISNLRYANDTTQITESEEELKSTLMKVKDESESWLKAQHSENEDHGIRSHHFMENRWGNCGNSVRLYFWGAPKSLQMVTAAMKLKHAYSCSCKTLDLSREQLQVP